MISLWVGVILCALSPGSATQAPADIAGIWDVVRVAVDGAYAMNWEFQPDDPQLIGRTLVLGPDVARFEEGKEIGCKQTTWGARREQWKTLFGKGFIRPSGGGRRMTPTPDDFEIAVPKNQTATVYLLCPTPARNRTPLLQRPWVALLAPGQLALHYDTQVLLVLKRRASDAKPVASFDCNKAASTTEKAICASFDLAAWDRSVALAFNRALERRTPAEIAAIRAGQETWLKTRNACGSDAGCIDEHQWRRVDELRQQ